MPRTRFPRQLVCLTGLLVSLGLILSALVDAHGANSYRTLLTFLGSDHILSHHSGLDFLRFSPMHSATSHLYDLGDHHSNERIDLFVPPLPQTGSSKIVFASNRDGSMQIYIMNADGSGATRLTNSGANDDFPRWSPNGNKILFQSDRDHPDTGYMDIYVMNSDGSGVTRLTTDPNDDSMASWSLDGSKIVFQSMRNGVNYQVYSMNADGSNQVNLSNSSSNDIEPSCSPNGAKIAFASDRDHAGTSSIYVMNSNGTEQQRLTFSAATFEDRQPAWSPDGAKITFVSTRDSATESWIETDDYEIPEDDGQTFPRSLLHVNKEVYVMNADGSVQTRLTNDLSNDESPSWSADGTKIIFRSDRERDGSDPMAQVWTMNADGTAQSDLSTTNDGDYSASWTANYFSPDSLAVNSHSGNGNQAPVAFPGGPYATPSGQPVQLSAIGSYDPDGSVVNYSWNFGDGTSGTGPVVNHQYNSAGEYSVSLAVMDNRGSTNSAQAVVSVNSATVPVRINFDELPNNFFGLGDHYLNYAGVKFYSNNQFAQVHTYQNCGPCTTTSGSNFISTKPDDFGVLNVEFTQPVSNLSFYMIGVDAFYNAFAILDVYRNGALSGTYPLYGNGTFTVGVGLGTLDNISKIVIRGINDANGIGFDDFSFSVPADVKITSGRVSGYLNGTMQKALLGADVALNAASLPGAFAGGSYSWAFTGSATPVTPMNQASATVRWTQPGTYRGTVTYTKGTQTATASLDIEVIRPTLTTFLAGESADQLNQDRRCSDFPLGVTYTLGCLHGVDGSTIGNVWSAAAQIPAGAYLSNPAQSGIKFVQAVSMYRKRRNNGNTECRTARASELNVDSGWQLDETNPYNNTSYFSEGNTIVLFDSDSPGGLIQGFSSSGYLDQDAQYVSDRFEVYIYYFTTNATHDESNPAFEQPLGLPNSSPDTPVARLSWGWGGLVVFDYYSFPHSLTYTLDSNTVAGGISATSASAPRSMSTNAKNLMWRPCGTSSPTSNPIDDSSNFVVQQYIDFLQRGPEPDGWNFWRSNITQCVFDEQCIANKRIDVARAFFYSTEFVGLHPDLAGQRGTHDYNSAFVYACYRGFLRREPNAFPDNNWNGFNFWVSKLDSTNPDAGDWKYNEMIKAFLESIEYRGRFEPLVP